MANVGHRRTCSSSEGQQIWEYVEHVLLALADLQSLSYHLEASWLQLKDTKYYETRPGTCAEV